MAELQAGDVDAAVPPSGTGCAECDDAGGWWMHLRRCAACGHVGCCDSSPGQHATAHWRSSGHPVMQSFEPGEDWAWDSRDDSAVEGVELAPPTARPEAQPSPGPEGRVPQGWARLLHR